MEGGRCARIAGRSGRDLPVAPAVTPLAMAGALARWRARLGLAVLLAAAQVAAGTADEDKIPFQLLTLPPSIGLPDSHANFVIRSPQQWDFWANNLTSIDEPLPSIDFERYTAIVASAGYKEHGPVLVSFDSIIDTGNVVRVHVTVSSPTTCPPQAVPGHYAVIALIARTDKPVQFDVSSRDTYCPFH